MNGEQQTSKLIVRPERAADYEAIYQINREAFGKDNEARLVDALRSLPGFIPELSLVAEEDGRLLGHVMFSPGVIETEDGEIPAIALGPVAVVPAEQNRGIGSMLIRQGLEDCRRLGHRLVIVLGHSWYYPRFGFTPARAMGIDAPFPCPDEAWMALELEPGAAAGVQGRFRYPEPFDMV